MKRGEEILDEVCGPDRGLLSTDAILPAIESAQREAWNEAIARAADRAEQLHGSAGESISQAIRSLHREGE